VGEFPIYLFNWRAREMIQRITGLSEVALYLVFKDSRTVFSLARPIAWGDATPVRSR
jgi:hypothetical protein